MTASRFDTGMVLGKFLPPHAGHLFLIGGARRQVKRLAVVVEHIAGESIPSALRTEWLRELAPTCDVVHLERAMPQSPSEHPQFWAVWEQALREVLPYAPQAVFASESYGAPLAQTLGARFVPVDPARSALEVSATAVRADPFGSWRHLPAPVRAHYALRVSVCGPESTGKSTLARMLARTLDTVVVPEHAQVAMAAGATERGGKSLTARDLEDFVRAQIASEDELARFANRVLVCDSDPLLTTVWSEHLFGDCPARMRALATARHYPLTLLCEADVPWVDDAHRVDADDRALFFARCEQALAAAGRRIVHVRGSWAERDATALAAVRALFDVKPSA